MQQQRIYQQHKSSIGNIDANVMALLAYLAPVILGFIPGISYVAWAAPLVLYFVEKNSLLVKFHAMQALAIQIVSTILRIIYTIVASSAAVGVGFAGGFIGVTAAVGVLGVFTLIYGVLAIILLVFDIIAMVKAYRYIEYRIPVAGRLAVWLMSKTGINLM